MKLDARDWIILSILFVVTAGIFYLNINVVEGSWVKGAETYIYRLTNDSQHLPPEQWPDKWMWEQKAPFKYRVLGRLPIWIIWKLSFKPPAVIVYWVYMGWAYLYMLATLYLLYSLVLMLFKPIAEHHPSYRALPLWGCLLFLTAPPVLFLFKFPVHTRPNDVLAYCLMLLGLRLILQQKSRLVCLVACVAVFCRENLLLIPLVYLITSHDPARRKYLLSLLPCLLLVIYRLAWWERYDISVGSGHNFEYPLETYGFFFLVFGALWLTGIVGYIEMKRSAYRQHPQWAILIKAFPVVTLLVIGTTVFLARVREMRILFLLFPFFIPFSVYWIIINAPEWKIKIRTPAYWICLGGVLAVILNGIQIMHPKSELDHKFFSYTFAHLYGGFGGGWFPILWPYLFIFLAILPFVFQYRRPQNEVDSTED